MKGTGGKQRRDGLQLKFLRLSLLMFPLVTVVVVVLFSVIITNRTKEMYANSALVNARIAADVVDGDAIHRYRDTRQKDAYYDAMLETLSGIRSAAGLKYLYVCIPEEDGYLYIWDAGDPAAEEGVMDLGDYDEYYGEGGVFMKGIYARAEEPGAMGDVSFEDNILVTDHEVYGYVASAFVPIYDHEGRAVALASVDVSMEKIREDILRLVISTVVFMAILMLIFAVIFYRQISRRVLKPIRRLDELIGHFVMDQMKQGNVLKCDIYTGDEIERLAVSFEDMSLELRDYMESFAAVTKEKERIGAELDVAKKIQEDMLPRIFPPYPDRSDFDIYATMDPAKEVGGDFYDLFLIDPNHLAMVIADVSGKGVPAALFMAITKSLIQSRTMQGGTPGEILSDVNDQLCQGNDAQYFVTVWLAILDLTTGDGTAANAGHEHPALRRGDGAFTLVTYPHDMPLGAMEGYPYRQHSFHLDRGDILFVYTDGVPEATNAEDTLYGTERMLAVLNAEREERGMRELLAEVKADVDRFVGEAPQFDDLTMLAFRLEETAKGSGNR